MAQMEILTRVKRRGRGLFDRLCRRTGHRVPALPVEDSVTANFLVCLETGTRHVALRRHLREVLGLTPAQYRRRWGLPEDYPMVAENYRNRRKHAAVLSLGHVGDEK